jgi:hypothetical protein
MKTNVAYTLFAVVILMAASQLYAQSGPYQYYTLTPCRVADTRNANGLNGGPAFGSGETRDFRVRGTCGVPLSARAAALNVTVTGASQASFLTIWPSGGPRPNVSALNFDSSTWALGNGAIVGLSQNTNDLTVFNAGGTVQVIIDVTGYFQ